MSKAKSNGARSNVVQKNSGNCNGERSAKAVIFARSACPEQGDESIGAQMKLCRDYATSHDIEVIQEIISVGKPMHEQFDAMLQFLKQNSDCRVIIVEKTDRLCRNVHDFIAWEDLVRQLKAELHVVKEARIIQCQAKSQDRLVEMLVLLSRNYVENLRGEIKKGQMAKAEKGQYPGRAPFGYTHDRKSPTIKVDPKRGPVVTRMFELCASGTHGTASLRRVTRGATGGTISASCLHNILKSRFYLGFFTWRGVEYKGIHKPLVDSRTFKRVQRVLSRMSTEALRGVENGAPRHD